MDLRQPLRSLRRRWKFAVAVFMIGIGAAGSLSSSIPPTYSSAVSVYFSTTGPTNFQATQIQSVYLSQRVDSYILLATEPSLVQRVFRQAGVDNIAGETAPHIDVVAVPRTVILRVTVTDDDPKVARAVARAEAGEIVRLVESFETAKIGKDRLSPVSARLGADATYDSQPVAPNLPFNLAMGAILGLLLGVAGAVMRDMIDTSIKSTQHLGNVTKSAVVAVVPFDHSVSRHPLISEESAAQGHVEAFRMLRTNLQFFSLGGRRQMIVVSSAMHGEGKTVTATNLAISVAQTGSKVLILDCDLRRPKVAQLLGLENSVGLLTVLLGTPMQECIQEHESGAHFLATGPLPPNPAEVLSTKAMRDLLFTLRDAYDVVIIDSPPMLPVTDPAIIAPMADGVLLVARFGRVTSQLMQQTVDRVESVGARIVGVILSMSPKRMDQSGGYQTPVGEGSAARARLKFRRAVPLNRPQMGMGSLREAAASSWPWLVTVLVLTFLILIGMSSRLLAGTAVGVAIIIVILACLGLSRAGALFVTVAMFLAPLNDLRLGSSYVTASDFIFVLGFVILTPTVLRNRVHFPSMFLLGLAILLTMGVIASLASAHPSVSANQLGRLLVGAFALPLFFMVWRPPKATIVRLAGAYMLGSVFNVAYALVSGERGDGGRYVGLTYHPNFLGLGCLLAVSLTPYVVATVEPRFRWVFWGASVVSAYGVWISGSRAALIVLIMLLVVYPFIERSISAAGAVLFGFAGVLAFSGSLLQQDGGSALGRLLGGGSATDSDAQREQLLSAALTLIRKHPLLGNGFDGGVGAHNIYVQVAVAAGIFGLIGYLLIMWTGLRTLFWKGPNHRLAYPVLAYAAIGPLTNTLWERLIWAVVALTFAGNVRTPAETDEVHNTPEDEPHAALTEIRNSG